MARVQRVMAKLGTMRKAEDFIVYPLSKTSGDASELVVQSDHRIAKIRVADGKAWLSVYKKNGAYFPHLMPFLGATLVDVPAALVAEFVAARPVSGDEIGPGVRVA